MKKVLHSIYISGLLLLPFIVMGQTAPTDFQTMFSQDALQGLDFSSITLNPLDQTVSSGFQEQISAEITPSSPRPGETVTIKLTSYSTNLDKAKITWRENSKIVLDQIGATEYTFTLGQLGNDKSVSVYIEKAGGGIIERSYFIVPTEVDLVYEPETYTPPFYRGRAWATHQSRIKVLAIPRILDDFDRLIPSDNYTYKWSLDGKVIQNQSGFGRNVFIYDSSLLADTTQISVEVEPRNYSALASASITINPVEPLVALYEKNPIYGTIFENAVTGTYLLSRNEITLEAIPYFFSNPNSDFTWLMNNQTISKNLNPREMTFRIENDTLGQSNISIRTVDSGKILQSAESTIILLFEKLENSIPTGF